MGANSYMELSMATENDLLINNEVVKGIANKRNKTVYQVVMRWAIQQGLAIIPKTVN